MRKYVLALLASVALVGASRACPTAGFAYGAGFGGCATQAFVGGYGGFGGGFVGGYGVGGAVIATPAFVNVNVGRRAFIGGGPRVRVRVRVR